MNPDVDARETRWDRFRAVRLRGDGVAELTVVPRRELRHDDVRLAVAYSGICHTDLHFIDGRRAARMADDITLGHEVSGTVVEVGAHVERWRAGDEVIVNPMGEREGVTWVLGVHYDGSWADEVIAPAEQLVGVSGIDLALAAIIPDAVSTPWAAITQTGEVRAGESAAVWGVGGLGFHAVQLLRLVGAVPVIAIDPSPAARARAVEAGADLALDPGEPALAETIRASTGGCGLDVAFDFFGHQSVQRQAFGALARYGRLILVGVAEGPLAIDQTPEVIRLSRAIRGHYGADRRHLEQIVSFVRHGRLDLTRSISRVFPLDDYDQALDVLRHKTGDLVRVLLTPASGDEACT